VQPSSQSSIKFGPQADSINVRENTAQSPDQDKNTPWRRWLDKIAYTSSNGYSGESMGEDIHVSKVIRVVG